MEETIREIDGLVLGYDYVIVLEVKTKMLGYLLKS